MRRTLQRDNEPLTVLYDMGEEIVGGIYFPLNRFSRGQMAKFEHHLQAFLVTLLGHPETRVTAIPIDR
jgi:hypothetical protein